MSAPINLKTATTDKPTRNDRAVRSLASSIFQQLQKEGCEPRDIISVSSELLDLVTNELQKIDQAATRQI